MISRYDMGEFYILIVIIEVKSVNELSPTTFGISDLVFHFLFQQNTSKTNLMKENYLLYHFRNFLILSVVPCHRYPKLSFICNIRIKQLEIGEKIQRKRPSSFPFCIAYISVEF